MRTRNSTSIGPDDTTMEGNITRVNDPQQHPLLPPPTTRTQQARRPPPPGPQRQHPPPPPTNRPSEVQTPQGSHPVSHAQPQQERTITVVTSPPRQSPTRMQQQHQPPPPRPPPLDLSPSQTSEHRPSPPSGLRRTAAMLPAARANEVAPLHLPNEFLTPPEESMNWILQVRIPISSVSSNVSGSRTMIPQQQQESSVLSPVRKIQMTKHPSMDAMTLSNCLQQCLNYYPNNNNDTSLAGLFCETTHTFYSLQQILSWDSVRIEEQQHFIYAVELPVVTPLKQQQEDGEGLWLGWYHYIVDELSVLFQSIVSNLYILLPIFCAILFYYQYNIVSDSILLTYTTIYSTMIEQPLRDIYHYGPWFIGWEGDDISTICARITYHGDAQFWLRNMSECQRIYAAKEQAFIRIVLPFIYIVCAVVFVYTIRFLIQEYQNYQFQLYNNHRNPLERDMADLYHSFHVILRQILQVHNNQQRPPAQQKHRPK
jgi:hypothetical protein